MASKTFQPAQKGDSRGNESWEKPKEAGREGLNKLEEAGQIAGKEGKEALEKVKQAGSEALGKVKEAGQSAGEMAAETAKMVGAKADDATAAAGHGIAGLGETVAEKGPHGGLAGRASQAVADTIKDTGKYLEEHKLTGMAKDVEQIVKNHPIPTLLIVFGIGWCLGRAMKD